MNAAEPLPLVPIALGITIVSVLAVSVGLIMRGGARTGGLTGWLAAGVVSLGALLALLSSLQPVAKGASMAAVLILLAAAVRRISARVAAIGAVGIIAASAYLAFFGHGLAAAQDYTGLLLAPFLIVLGCAVAIIGMAISRGRSATRPTERI